VSRDLDPAHPGPSPGLFQPTRHVFVVTQGSTLAILDLERGVVHATTPFGADAWEMLVGGRSPSVREEGGSGAGVESKGGEAWSLVAGYFYDHRLIELGEASFLPGTASPSGPRGPAPGRLIPREGRGEMG
jgi:hypothetical protein